MRQEEIFREKNISQVRDYWNACPCNIRHSPQPVGSREYFDEVEARKYLVEPHIPGFAEFPRWKGKRVLEIGCGIGTDTINFARAGARVTAVDLSEKSLELARRRADVFGLSDRIDFRVADAERLSEIIPPEPYDLVYSFGVIHHTPHPEKVVEQVRRHFVRADSEFKVMVYHRNSWKVLWILLAEGKGAFWKLDEQVARNSEAQTGCPVTFTYTPATVRDLLRGFRVETIFIDHIFPYRIRDYVQYRYVKNWYFRILPAAVFRGMERRFGWHLCVTASPEPG
jgi:SAM-dependent methyltransferase